MDPILTEIQKTEEAARKHITDAHQKAESELRKAREKSAHDTQVSMDAIAKESSEQLHSIVESLEKDKQVILKKSHLQAAALEKKVAGNMDKAVDVILRYFENASRHE